MILSRFPLRELRGSHRIHCGMVLLLVIGLLELRAAAAETFRVAVFNFNVQKLSYRSAPTGSVPAMQRLAGFWSAGAAGTSDPAEATSWLREAERAEARTPSPGGTK